MYIKSIQVRVFFVVIIRILKGDERYILMKRIKKLDPTTKNSKLESYLFIFCINFSFNFKFNLKFVVVVVVVLFKQVQLYLSKNSFSSELKNFNYNNGLINISKLNILNAANKQVFRFCRLFGLFILVLL